MEQFAASVPDGDARLTVEWLMKRLPAEQAAFLRMKMEGLTHAEMAVKLGIPAKRVSARWIRIRNRLRKDVQRAPVPDKPKIGRLPAGNRPPSAS